MSLANQRRSHELRPCSDSGPNWWVWNCVFSAIEQNKSSDWKLVIPRVKVKENSFVHLSKLIDLFGHLINQLK